MVDTVELCGEVCTVMFPDNEASWMQLEGLAFGATQAVNVPTLYVELGTPKT
jgi:hypothetical protein